MATNYNLPAAGSVFPGFIGPDVGLEDQLGILHSFNIIGGHSEMPALQDMYEIPIAPDAGIIYAGFSQNGDGGWSTGRRRIGQTVYVIEQDKTYRLIPKGYWGNDGELGMTEWLALSEADKAVLIDPAATVTYGQGTPPPFPPPALTQTGTGNAADCWVEIVGGADNIYTSNLTESITMTEDVGGMQTGTAVSDLTNIKTYDQLFDTILFPTSYPTYGNPSAGLSDNVSNLQTIGSSVNLILNTTANLGTISLNGVAQGQYAGNIQSAIVSYPGAAIPEPGVGPAGNAIDNVSITGHPVTIGNNTWSMLVTFPQGPMPLDSTGADYPSIQYAGGTKSASSSFEGVYPIKLGESTGNANFSDRALLSHGASLSQLTCSQAYDEGATRHRIGIAMAMINGRTVGFQQYNPVSSSYADLDASEFTNTPQIFTIEGNTVDYTVYTKASPAGGGDVSGLPLYRIKFS
jgi:hypothetical protein